MKCAQNAIAFEIGWSEHEVNVSKKSASLLYRLIETGRESEQATKNTAHNAKHRYWASCKQSTGDTGSRLAHLKSDININQLSKAKQKPMANRFECVQYIYLVWACSLPSRSYPLGKPLTTFIWKARASDHSRSLPISLHPITVWSGLQMIMAPENEIQKLPQCTSFRF